MLAFTYTLMQNVKRVEKKAQEFKTNSEKSLIFNCKVKNEKNKKNVKKVLTK